MAQADLSGAYLMDADLIGADLEGAMLVGANLTGADLSTASLRESSLTAAVVAQCRLAHADLSHTDLISARFANASLAEADLRQADLRNADLSGADFTGADLSGAKLGQSRLVHTKLRNVRLRRADMSGARVGGALFAATDLSSVVGLEGVRHWGPSTVGTDTLAKSRGRVSTRFLQGCGLRDWEIEGAKLYRTDLGENERTDVLYAISELQRGNAIRFYSVFISYSHVNSAFATKLHDALQERGIRCWLDEKSIKVGDRIRHAVDEGIRLSDKILVCCSETSLNESTWVEEEIEKALEKERLARKERRHLLALVPLDLDGSVHDWDHALKTTLLSRKAADFRGWQDDEAKFNASLERVIAALRLDEGGREPVPEGRL